MEGISFRGRGIILIEFKLGSEISPDTCRFWEMKTGKSPDKGLF
ncbi:phosphoribosylaminoimidazolesuccinocarboxamide synthase [Thermococcus gorgonarius]|nr:phosphoribosylaminoimidazolesuccinocarboxamide synthase [Thermococcus gorgonarius]